MRGLGFVAVGLGINCTATAGSVTINDMYCDPDIEDAGELDEDDHRNGADEDLDDTDDEDEDEDESIDEDDMGYDDL